MPRGKKHSGRCESERLERRTLFAGTPALAAITAHPFVEFAPYVTSTVPNGYTPAQMRQAYGFDNILLSDGSTVAKGAGQTIAIVTAFSDPNIRADVAAFSRQWALAQMNGNNGRPTLQIVQTASNTATDEGWGVEMSLDVEWAHAIAPRANIVLVEAPDNSLSSLLAAVDVARNLPGVDVVSMSWGASEFSTETNYDGHFKTPPGHNGITFVAASGDQGAPVSWPAVSLKVIAVGGTTLNLDANGNYVSEQAWSGSGGGVSSYMHAPSYQTNGFSTRSSPDISYDADPATGVPVYDSFGYSGKTGWFKVGGTSIGVPQVAGLIAIADQQRQDIGKPRLFSRSQALPAIYSAPSSTFHDITTGSTTGAPQYAAATGYDLTTGFGSVYADRFSSQLLLA